MRSIEARIRAAEEKVKPAGRRAPIMRCWLSDGSVRDMHIIEAVNYVRCRRRVEPHIIRAECISDRDKAPHIVELFIQMVERDNA